jgi:hypothetical protein
LKPSRLKPFIRTVRTPQIVTNGAMAPLLFLAQVESTTCSDQALLVLTLMSRAAEEINASADVPSWVKGLIGQLPMLLRTGIGEDGKTLWAAKVVAC